LSKRYLVWASLTDDAGGRLLHAAEDPTGEFAVLGVNHADEVGPVVHGEVRGMVERGDDVTVIGLVVFTSYGEDGDAEVLDEARGDVVLGGEGIGAAEDDASARGLEGAGEVGGLGGDVETGGETETPEGLFRGETPADEFEHGHVRVGPENALLAGLGEPDVLDIVFHRSLL
jgi:hypothetical protein